MKTLIKLLSIAICLATFAGCSTLQKQIDSIVNMSSQFSTAEWHHNAWLTNGEIQISENEDGTKNASARLTSKVPGGPEATLEVEGLKPPPED